MKIEKLLQENEGTHERDLLEMIMSNRMTHYIPGGIGAVIAIKDIDHLIDDLLEWNRQSR